MENAHKETNAAKAFRTFIRVYLTYKIEQLSTKIKLTLDKALSTSIMTSACCAWKFAADIPQVLVKILFRDLKGTMGLDRSRDMSVYVPTCTSYHFSTLKPVVWKLWRW
jgi:hypothetical protein